MRETNNPRVIPSDMTNVREYKTTQSSPLGLTCARANKTARGRHGFSRHHQQTEDKRHLHSYKKGERQNEISRLARATGHPPLVSFASLS